MSSPDIEVLEQVQIVDPLDKAPEPLYTAYMFHLLKSWGADVSKIDCKFCYKEFINHYSEYSEHFLQYIENSPYVQPNLKILLIDNGILKYVTEERLNAAFSNHTNQII